ncbi:VHS domain-containing protein [Coprinopsis cinerea AmutBmut pab1-1]|nr:VHS domain-containing protein [Coprinopsis cinerea AmutBmut pab1-1]
MLSSPTSSGWSRPSQIEILVTRACDPSLPEPNYALHLEVADYINKKKANREAAMTIARLANHRNPHVAILALALLDTLVQSCGYPFHLQISTKEFLNELVRRFPERPPPFPGPVMSRILDLIHGWKETICVESRWKEDLGNIRDMHRLLTFKGYRFRDFPRPQPSVAAAANLKTAEELEEEDREAQSAKLQELIRRGTPRDLAAAQELMKSLAGANPEAKPDYRAQALTELNKLEQKVILLNEMLDNVDPNRGEKFVDGDAYDQVSAILKAARPKIQKWISDAQNDDPESLDTFLQINDQINTVMTRYEAFKKGDYSVAAHPLPNEAASSSAQPQSLIDFDDESESSSAQPAASTAPLNDLSGLFSSPAPPQVTTTSTIPPNLFNLLGNSTPQQQPIAPQPVMGSSNGQFGAFGGMNPPQPTNTPPAAIRLGGTPVPNVSLSPNCFNTNTGPTGPASGFAKPRTMGSVQSTSTPQFQPLQPQASGSQSSAPASTSASSQAKKDPFADLAGLF